VTARGVRRALACATLAVFALGNGAYAAQTGQPVKSTVRGRVLDAHGKPIVVAQVLLVSILSKTVFAGAATATDGSFAFHGMQPGPYGLIAQLKRECAVSHAITVKPAKTYDVVMHMDSSSHCYGAIHFAP
jgi:protocatechuate 3,4-dioxygenase beta subunit